MDRLASPRSDDERRDDAAELAKLHPGNRFRRMFGRPLLPQPEYDVMTPDERHKHDRKISQKMLDEYGDCGNS